MLLAAREERLASVGRGVVPLVGGHAHRVAWVVIVLFHGGGVRRSPDEDFARPSRSQNRRRLRVSFSSLGALPWSPDTALSIVLG
jgi:hypothetical protein